MCCIISLLVYLFYLCIDAGEVIIILKEVHLFHPKTSSDSTLVSLTKWNGNNWKVEDNSVNGFAFLLS